MSGRRGYTEEELVARMPESTKLIIAATLGRQEIVEFLEWAASHGLALCELVEGGEGASSYQPTYRSTEALLATYFDIDLAKVEAERRALLAELRGEGIAVEVNKR